MLRHGLVLSLVALVLIACSAPPLPTTSIPPTVTTPSATRTEIPIAAPVVVSTLALPEPSDTEQPTDTVTPSATASTTASPTASPTLSATLVSSLPTRTVTGSPTRTRTRVLTLTPKITATTVLTGSPTLAVTEVSTNTPTVTVTADVAATPTVSATQAIPATATKAATRTPTVRATTRPSATRAPTGPAVLTQLFSGQRVTAMYVSGDGTIYYGVAPSDESLQFPARTVFQLWKWSPGGAPYAITPPTMHLIGGVLVHNGMIYFNEQGTLRRLRDGTQPSEGEIVIRFPGYLNNRDLPYGHMNNSLATYNLNGREVMLMGMGSLWDSSFASAGQPAVHFIPDYEHFPTGRINYAAFEWLDNTHDFTANNGVAGEFDEFARGVRNPWSMAVGTVNGKTHILAVDNDPAFTPEKSDDNPANAGDEVNDIVQFGNYGHPYAYGMASNIQPIVVFRDGSVPSGVAVAAGKIFVSLQNGNEIVKVDLVKRTYTPVLTNISPFNLFGLGNLLYVADFDGIHVIDARGL